MGSNIPLTVKFPDDPGRRRQLVAFLTVLALTIGAAATAYYTRIARESANNRLCQNRLERIGLALLNFRDRHGAFPPVCHCDSVGSPTNSWRVLVIDRFLYNFNRSGYDLNQPWNGPRNTHLKLDTIPIEAFQCPSAKHDCPAITDYVVVTGPNTIWSSECSCQPPVDESDMDKILAIEVVNSDVRWMEPRDLTFEQALQSIQPTERMGIGSNHPGGINYVTVSGKVRTLDRNIDGKSLRRLLTRTFK